MSDLRVNSIAGADGTSPATLVKQSAAKAWANINQSSFGVRDSFNISSVTDVSSGQADFNVATDFTNSNYSLTYGTRHTSVSHDAISPTSSSVYRQFHATSAGTNVDAEWMMNSAHGDLA